MSFKAEGMGHCMGEVLLPEGWMPVDQDPVAKTVALDFKK